MFDKIYNLTKVALGCSLVLTGLHIGPPRIYIFDSFSNFSQELFAFFLLFTGIWLIGFFNESRKKMILKKMSTMKTLSLCLYVAIVFYGFLFPHYNHLELVFGRIYPQFNYFISFVIFTLSMVFIGAAEVELKDNRNTDST